MAISSLGGANASSTSYSLPSQTFYDQQQHYPSQSSIQSTATASFGAAAKPEHGRISSAVLELVRHFISRQNAMTDEDMLMHDQVHRVYQYCMRILGSLMLPQFSHDEAHIVDAIKKKRSFAHHLWLIYP